MKKALIFIVKGYQLLISPLLGNNCRFYPSCSHYMIQAIEQRGILIGLFLGIKRLLKCHPWHEGGIDPVPQHGCSSEMCSSENHRSKKDNNTPPSNPDH